MGQGGVRCGSGEKYPVGSGSEAVAASESAGTVVFEAMKLDSGGCGPELGRSGLNLGVPRQPRGSGGVQADPQALDDVWIQRRVGPPIIAQTFQQALRQFFRAAPQGQGRYLWRQNQAAFGPLPRCDRPVWLTRRVQYGKASVHGTGCGGRCWRR